MAVSTALSSGFELIGLWPDDGSTRTRKSGSRNILRIFQGRTQWIPVSGRKYGIVRIDLARCDRECICPDIATLFIPGVKIQPLVIA